MIIAASLGAVAGANAENREKPNILWVMSEDQGHDLACYGMPAVKTPVLDKMAEEGIMYTNACCTNPISSPSRSAMMTGTHQVIIDAHNHRSNRDKPLPLEIKPITCYLREQGYTCILGNSHVMDRGRKTDCNFKSKAVGEWNGIDQFGLFDKFDEFTAEDQPFFAQIQLKVTHRGDWWKSVTAASEHPVNPDDVVLPSYLPDHPKVREEFASYLDQVEEMDREMGILIEELRRKGVLDNTIVFFIGDNGRCDVKGKGYLYEPGIRVPMIIWGKGIKPARVDEIVSTLDISATIVALSGYTPLPRHMSGNILFDFETGEAVPTGQEALYVARDNWDEVRDCMRGIYTTQFAYIRNYMPEVGWDQHQIYLDFHRPALHIMRMLKEQKRLNRAGMLFLAEKKPVEELYDTMNDPDQINNLAENPAYEPILVEMRKRMDEWQASHRDGGLIDLDTRRNPSLRREKNIRDWVQEHYPEDWLRLTQGEICDQYVKWRKEMEAQEGEESGKGLKM